jgi:anti-sigma regulatory factor (Ser/Thr protein kinase)
MPERMARSTAELSIRAEAGELRRASAWLEQCGSERGVPADQIGRLDVCLNEALANIFTHGGEMISAPVLLRLEVRHEEGVHAAAVTVSDAGHAFDPFSIALAPRPENLAEARPGGLGLVMIRSFSDDLGYRHVDGRNELTFGVRWSEA